MHHIKKWLVALDLTHADEDVLHCVEAMSAALLPDSITFLHVVPELNSLATVFATPADRMQYWKEREDSASAQLHDLIDDYFGHRSDIHITVDTVCGSPLKQVLQKAADYSADLVVVGKKKASSGSGVVAQKLARRLPCSILFIPEGFTRPIKKITVPVDFTEGSSYALDVALASAHLMNDPMVEVLHVYDVPPVVSLKIGRTPEQFDQMIRANVQTAADRFLAEHETGSMHIELVLESNKQQTTARQIITHTELGRTDWLIIGAKGHSLMEILFIGSVTEKIITHPINYPVMVVRIPDKDDINQ